MLSQTKEEIQLLVNKVQTLEFVLGTLNMNHKEYSNEIETQYKTASFHKLKLTSEILRLLGAERLAVVVNPAIENLPLQVVDNQPV